MDCPQNVHARREFQLVTNLSFFFRERSTVDKLALLVARIREDVSLINALARFTLQVQRNRCRLFRHLSSEARKEELARLLAEKLYI